MENFCDSWQLYLRNWWWLLSLEIQSRISCKLICKYYRSYTGNLQNYNILFLPTKKRSCLGSLSTYYLAFAWSIEPIAVVSNGKYFGWSLFKTYLSGKIQDNYFLCFFACIIKHFLFFKSYAQIYSSFRNDMEARSTGYYYLHTSIYLQNCSIISA